jgi:hypothetical protein
LLDREAAAEHGGHLDRGHRGFGQPLEPAADPVAEPARQSGADQACQAGVDAQRFLLLEAVEQFNQEERVGVEAACDVQDGGVGSAPRTSCASCATAPSASGPSASTQASAFSSRRTMAPRTGDESLARYATSHRIAWVVNRSGSVGDAHPTGHRAGLGQQARLARAGAAAGEHDATSAGSDREQMISTMPSSTSLPLRRKDAVDAP